MGFIELTHYIKHHLRLWGCCRLRLRHRPQELRVEPSLAPASWEGAGLTSRCPADSENSTPHLICCLPCPHQPSLLPLPLSTPPRPSPSTPHLLGLHPSAIGDRTYFIPAPFLIPSWTYRKLPFLLSQLSLSPCERDYGWALHGDFSDRTGKLISPGLVAADG